MRDQCLHNLLPVPGGTPGLRPKLPLLDHPHFRCQTIGTIDLRFTSVFIFKDVLEELCYRAIHQPHDTASSMLSGGHFTGPLGPYVEISGFRDTVPVTDSRAFIDYLRRTPSLLKPLGEEHIVGFAHFRPGQRARIAAADILAHNTFFIANHPVTLLIDGINDDLALYTSDTTGRFHNVGAFLIDPIEADEAP